MQLSDIKVDKTYEGSIDYKRGLGTRRKVIAHDTESGLVTVKNIVGPNPPSCYVDLANIPVAEFAAWATSEVAA